MASVRVVLDGPALMALLSGPSGPVSRDLHQRANRVLNKARYLCPVDNGVLRASLAIEMSQVRGGTVARVGTNVPYAIHVHEGTKYMAGRPFLKEALDAAR
jgi:hypothetical protein